MLIGTNRRSGQTVAGLARSFRVGVSATGLLLAGTALAPAAAQVLDLGGLTVTRTDLTGFTEVTNGVLRINPVPAFSYGGALTDSLGQFFLTKIGGTTLTLTGGGLNTFSGQTTVSSGLVLAGAANVLSPNSVVAINAGRVDIAGFDQTVAGLTGGGQLENSGGAAAVTVNTAGDLVYNGVISGSTTVVMNGSGRQSFGGASTYTGGTVLNSGTLGFVNSQAFGTGAITVAGAAELESITLALNLGNDIVLNADLTARFGQNVTWSGIVSGGAANQLIKEGNGILTLTGANTYAGGTAFDRGQINVSGNSALGTGTITTTATQVSLGTAGNISAVVDNAIVLNGFMNFELPDVGNTLTLNGPISGPGALFLKSGNGTLVLNSANTISVPTLLASGFLGLGDDAAAGTGTIRVSGTGGISAYANVAVANAIRTSNNTVVDTRGFDMALNGVIRNDSTGPGGIEKVGAGVLTLSADSVYTGETFVNGGSLILDGNITSDTFVASGATLGGSGSVGNGNIVNVSSGGIIEPGAAGGGAGTLTVGNLFLGAGSIFNVELADPNVVGSSVNDLIIVTDTLTLDGATVNVLALPGFQTGTYRVMEFTNLAPGALLIAGTAPATYSFTIDVNSALGQVNLLVAQSAIGPVQYWDGGDLVGVGGVAGGNGTWNAANTNWTDSAGAVNGAWGSGTGIFQTVGGTVTVEDTQLFENLTFSVDGYVLNGGNLQTNGSTLAVANGATTTINSTLVGANGIVKTGSGNVVLGAANSYTGLTDVQGGTLTVGNDDALGTGNVTLRSNTTLASTNAPLIISNNINLAGNATVRAGGLLDLLGDITGGGKLTVDAPTAALLLGGNNSYSGGTSILAGSGLVLTDSTSAGTGLIEMADNSRLLADGGNFTTANAIAISGTGVFQSIPVGQVWTLSGTISDGGSAGTLEKVSADSTLVLSGDNSFSGGLLVDAGTVQLNTDTAAGTGAITLNALTVLAAGAPTLTLANDVVVAGVAQINSGTGTMTIDGVVSGSAQLIKTNTGTLVLTAANTHDGGIDIVQGTLRAEDNAALGTGDVFINGGATLQAGVAGLVIGNDVGLYTSATIDTQAFDTELTGTLFDAEGPGGVSKIGGGILTLSGDSTYTGDTDVDVGTLNVTGSLANTAVTVASGATLSGNGTIGGAVTILDGGNLNPGTSPGTLTVGALTLNALSNLNYELGAVNTVAGPFNDLVAVTGNLVLDGLLNVTVPVAPPGGSFGTGAYQLFTYGGALTDNGLTINSLPGGATGLVQTAIAGQVNLFVLTPGTVVQYWDGADFVGNGAIDGGTGNWTEAGTNWTGDAPSAINSDWQDGSVAVFAGATGTVTLADTFQAQGLQFTTSAYTLNGGALDTGPALGTGTFVSVNSGIFATINSQILGDGEIVKQGAGTLLLGGNNIYTGGTDLQAGVLTVLTNSALGTGDLAMASGTTLRSGAPGLDIANNINVTGQGIIGTQGNVFTLSGVISDGTSAGNLEVRGAGGTLNLTNSNTYTGGTNVNSDVTVAVFTNSALGTGVLTLQTDATLTNGVNFVSVFNGITTVGNGLVDVVAAGNEMFVFGNIGGPGSISQVGDGNLHLLGNNSFTNLGINAGIVTVYNNSAAGAGFIAINNDATLAAGANGVVLTNIVTTTGNGLVDAGGAGNVFTLDGDIGGPGSISQIGLGNLVLNGDNSFTNLGINAGIVTVGTDTAAGIGFIAINDNATLAAGANNLVLTNIITTTGNGLVDAGGAGNVFTLNGNIGGPGSISQIGLGNLVLNGNNDFTNLGINAGIVTVGTNSAAGIGFIAINNDATLAAGANGLVLTNIITTTANGLVDAGGAGNVFTLNGNIGGPGSISQIGLGNLVLNGNNDFTNLGINAGTVTLGTDSAAGIGTIAINNDATLAAGVTGLNIANDITTTANGLVDAGPAGFVFTLNGDIGGPGSISQVGLGNLVLNGNNSFTNLGINAGTVTLGTDSAAGIGTIAINNDATLAAGVSGLNIANAITTTANGIVDAGPAGFVFTLNGDIGGAGSISQVGAGNLVLNGNDSFTNLGINAGTVTLGTDTAAGIGTIAINNDATLAAGVSGLNIANAIITTANGLVDAGPAGFVFTLNGDIAGPGSISQVGAGNLVLNGNNSFTNLGINAGTVTLGTDTAAGIGSIAINNDATLAAGVSGLNIANDIITTANGIVDAGPAGFVFTLNGDIAGPGSISQVGAGNLVLNGNNSFTNLGINQGIVTLGTDTAAGIGTIAINNDATLAAGANGLVIANAITTTANGLVDAGGAGNVFTLNGDIGGPGSISQIGLGNLVLNGNNSFTNLGINQGTATLGTDTAAGIGAIAINNDATLAAGANGLVIANAITTTANGIVDAGPAGNVFTLNGDIGGPGSISQVGAGNLVLNGNNSFTNLGINQGIVTLGTDTAAGIGAIAINNDATLAAGANGLVIANAIVTTANGIVDAGPAGNVFTLNGDIGGAGSISQVGAGNLVLNGDNSFTNLGINAGTVTVGTDTAAGIGSIAINDGATLAAGVSGLTLGNLVVTTGNGTVDSGAGTFTLAGIIAGDGSITKTGSGTLTLTGDNSFAGGMTITEGTVVGSVASVGPGAIVNNGALVFDQATNATYAQVISGTGSLTKAGVGMLTLSAVNTLTGPTTVTAGILNVTGSLAASPTTVTGGALWGTGSVGALTVQAGGTVAPGAVALQSGTLTVNGALTLASGSTLVIDAGSDLLAATGAASIAGNLVVNPIGTGFRFGEQVIVSSTARTGQFASTSFTGGFGPAIAPSISYTATSVILELNPVSLVATGGSSLSPNSLQVASAFDTAVANGYDANPFFALYNQGPNLNNALSQLSGELHSAERRVLLEDTRIVRETAFDRLNTGLAAIAGNQQVTSDVNGGDFTFWLRGAGSWGSANADGVGSDFNTSQWGVLTGVDYAKDGFKVGAMFHYTSTDVTFDNAALGKSTVETTGGAIYGGYRSDAGWAVGIGGSYAGNNANGNRSVTAPGLAQTLDSSIGGTTYQVFGEIAYDFIAAPEMRVEPFGRIAYAGIDSNDFLEVGGIAAIEADSQSNDLTIFNLGLRAAYDVGAVRFSGSASWQNTSGDRSGGVNSTITGLDSLMYIQAVALDGDAANLEAQVSYGFTDKIRLGVGYSGLIGGNNSDNGVRATLSVGF